MDVLERKGEMLYWTFKNKCTVFLNEKIQVLCNEAIIFLTGTKTDAVEACCVIQHV